MKVRMPKSFMDLPQSEKDKINEVLTEEVENRVNADFVKLQRVWLKFACIVLNKCFGFGEGRAKLFLANWREMYRLNTTMKTEAEQTAYLEAEMSRIFRKEGYPESFVDKLERIGEEK